jgi:hypothetical protein
LLDAVPCPQMKATVMMTRNDDTQRSKYGVANVRQRIVLQLKVPNSAISYHNSLK